MKKDVENNNHYFVHQINIISSKKYCDKMSIMSSKYSHTFGPDITFGLLLYSFFFMDLHGFIMSTFLTSQVNSTVGLLYSPENEGFCSLPNILACL